METNILSEAGKLKIECLRQWKHVYLVEKFNVMQLMSHVIELKGGKRIMFDNISKQFLFKLYQLIQLFMSNVQMKGVYRINDIWNIQICFEQSCTPV